MFCLEATDHGGKRIATTKAGKASIIQSLSSGARLVISLFSGSGASQSLSLRIQTRLDYYAKKHGVTLRGASRTKSSPQSQLGTRLTVRFLSDNTTHFTPPSLINFAGLNRGTC